MNGKEDNAIYTVNRSVLIAKGKEPFLKWIQNLPDPTDITLKELNRDCSMYLIPNYEYEYQVEELIRENFITVFENELLDWWLDPKEWPDITDYGLFRKWFDVEVHSLIRDLVSTSLLREEL